MSGYKMLSNDELSLFLDDIHSSINDQDPSHFERIIKYLIYVINMQLKSSLIDLYRKTSDTVTYLLSKKAYLLNIELPKDYLASLGITSTYKYLFEVLFFNQLDWAAKSMSITIIPFLISILNVSLTNLNLLKFRNYIKTTLYQRLSSLITETFDAFPTVANAQINKAVIFLIAMNNHEVLTKLMINSLKMELCLKRAWIISAGREFIQLRCFLLLMAANNVLNSTSVETSQLNVLLDWILSYLYSSSYDNLVAEAISKCVLILLKVSIKFGIVFNLQTLLKVDHFLEDPKKLPDIILKSLFLIKNYKEGQKLTLLSHPELDHLVKDINKFLSNHVLDYYESPMSFKSVDTHADLEKWLALQVRCIDGMQHEYRLYTFISAASNFPCLVRQSFDFKTRLCRECSDINNSSSNPYQSISPTRPTIPNEGLISTYYNEIVIKLISLKIQDPMITSNVLLLLYKLYASYRPSRKQPLATNPTFQFLKTMLVDKNRTIRQLASRCLPLFLIEEKDLYLDEVFSVIFQFLSSINFSKDIYLAETTIRAFTEIATISSGEWLNVLLLRLIDLLAVENEHHINLSCSSFMYIAKSKEIKPYKLLSPYLPVVSVKLLRTPKLLAKILETCNITETFFLNLTKDYTVPFLLDYYQYDYIQDIAVACNFSKEKLIDRLLPKILATYLVRDDKINYKYILNILKHVGYQKKVTLADLYLNAGIGSVACSILLLINYDENWNIRNEEKVINALAYIAKIDYGDEADNSSRDLIISRLLGDHILEIIQEISKIIYQISTPFLEKILAVKAIEFLVTHNPSAVTSVLSQISTSLQSLISKPEFEFISINCLNLIINTLDLNNLISIFDIIISLIFQKFPDLEKRSRTIATEILDNLFSYINKFKDHGKFDYSLYYFSIPFIKGLDQTRKFNKNLKDFRNLLKPRVKISYLPEFTRRLKTLNGFVVRQALVDLITFTDQLQGIIQQELKDLNANSSIFLTELINTLLDTSYKFKSYQDKDISVNCAKALAILGSLDSNKFSLKRIKPKITLVHNFHDFEENCKFLTDLIENIVVINFWASDNPIKQMHYSFAMQEFLKGLKLYNHNLPLTNRTDTARPTIQTKVWNNFNDISKSTLYPFLHSKFIYSNKSRPNLEYPIYKKSMNHEDWLITLCNNLISKPSPSSSSAHKAIISAFTALIRQNDMSVCNYLLRYLVLSSILNSKDFSKEFIGEINAIFSVDIKSLSSTDSIESLKACYQTIFDVLDYLHQWKSLTVELYNDSKAKTDAELGQIKDNLISVDKLLSSIAENSLIEKLTFSGDYERTILYIENEFRAGKITKEFITNNLDSSSSLHSMYSNINDIDSLDGLLKSFSTRNTDIQLRGFQYNENWSIAQEAFNVLSDNNQNTAYRLKFLKSLNDHASYEEVLSNLNSSLKDTGIPDFSLDWSLVGLESSMLSGDIDQLKKWFYITESIGKPQDVEHSIVFKLAGGLIDYFKTSDINRFESTTKDIYRTIGTSLNNSSSSLSRNLSLMRQLHLIQDINLLLSQAPTNNNIAIIQSRLDNIDESFDSKWKVLSMHKFINICRKDYNQINQIFLQCSRLARDNSKNHLSIASIMKAMKYNYKNSSSQGIELQQETNFEYAQLLWDQGKHTDAIKILEAVNLDDIENLRQKAKFQLQYAEWLNESNHSSSSTIIDEYTKAYSIERHWEKPYYALGKYYDKLLESQNNNNGYYQQQVIKSFLKALSLGPTYIFEALPKLITIWLDFAQSSKLTKEAERSLLYILKDIKQYNTDVPDYVWYTAITQMLSRISHRHLQSVRILQDIISRVLRTYPRQSLWFVWSHSNSKDKTRKERVNAIVDKFIEADNKEINGNQFLLNDTKSLFGYFISIAEKKLKKGTRKVSISQDLHLSDLFQPFGLVIPVRSNLEIKLPNNNHTKNMNFAFAKSSSVTFNGIDDQVNVFMSLQMPKQITVRGNDGRAYRLMLKKDDTRKDAKVVELTTLINRLLSLNTEARSRNLSIPNYSVTPLATNLGVIEFVSNVTTMKSVVHEERIKNNVSFNDKNVFTKLDKAQKIFKSSHAFDDGESKAKLLVTFENILLDNPPVLYEWFIDHFSDPTSWYLARNSFVRSAAVMSIVGYIIGLGDRHCENILFFKSTGSVLHIDFDCLFEKGATLPTPEIVPFRLTQNMVDAMGINKVEGAFRKTCEVTDSILRDNEPSLMNNLETLIYDPLLDWENQQNPQEHLRKVRRKLIGLMDEKDGLPMNVHGQVDILIQLASSNDNLSQMYGGWAPHI